MFNQLLKSSNRLLVLKNKVVNTTTLVSSTSSTVVNSNKYRYYSSGSNGNNYKSTSSSTNNKYKYIGLGSVLFASTIATVLTSLDDGTTSSSQELKETVPPTPSAAAAKAQAPDHDIEKFKYIIVGGGTSAYYAVDKILEKDKEATILIVSKERQVPYRRPPLSKNIWSAANPQSLEYQDWSGKSESLLYEPESVYGNDILQFISNRRVIDIHVDGKVILLNDGTLVAFDKLLIATGGEPRRLNFTAKDDPRVTTYRTVDDFNNLYKVTRDSNTQHITIIGGGFLGSELTCSINDSLKQQAGGKSLEIAQLFPEKGVLPLVLPEYLSDYATEQVKNSGVDIRPGKSVKDVVKNETNNRLVVKMDDGSSLETDHVVVAVGLVPNTDVAKSTSLEIDPRLGGYVVNAELQARSNIYVAGDAASFYDFSLGTRRRIEHHDHARATGELAGKNMAGGSEPYTYQPFFWSDLTNHIGFEAVGNTDSKLKTYSVWDKEEAAKPGNDKFAKGIIYYLNDKNRVVGVLTFRNYGKMEQARQLISKQKEFSSLDDLKHAISLIDEPHH